MGDAKLYVKTKASDLRDELLKAEKKPKSSAYKKTVLKKIIANMTMGNNEVAGLMPEVVDILRAENNIASVAQRDLEIKRLCYLFLTAYAHNKPREAVTAIPLIEDDFKSNAYPVNVRILCIKTLSSINIPEYLRSTVGILKLALADPDPIIKKTAAFAVAQLHEKLPEIIQRQNFLAVLNDLLHDSNVQVVTGALQALSDISERSPSLKVSIDKNHVLSLLGHLSNTNEWGQMYIINALMFYVPQLQQDSVEIVERLIPFLQHRNSSIVLNTLKVIVYLNNYATHLEDTLPVLPTRISNAISHLMSKTFEIQFLTMRNLILLLLSKSKLVKLDVKTFFCQYEDPIYIKDTKLEIIFLLADEANMSVVLKELNEYALEIDPQTVRKAIRAIGNLAIKIDSTSKDCVDVLTSLLSNSISYMVQEVSIVVKDILRRFPGKFNFLVSSLVQHIDLIDESESKAAIIWVIGEYNRSIDDSAQLLSNMYHKNSFLEESTEVQLVFLTAVMKVYVCNPTARSAEPLLLEVFKCVTEEVNNPDVRQRGFQYWRIISSQNGKLANIKQMIFPKLPVIDTDNDKLPLDILKELEMSIGSLASIYLRPVHQVFRMAKPKKLEDSPALAIN